MRSIIGLERFIADSARAGRRYGFVTNPSAIMPDGCPAWRAFMDAGLELAALFGPEHGFKGSAQDCVEVSDESFRGVPAYSLYGERQKPTAEQLRGLDAVVFDIQDIGCRYYTFIYTLAAVMEACAESCVPLIVLDRPNPIGGLAVEGGPISAEASSFVGGYGLCQRHGMTVGEIALYLKGEYYQDAVLEVVALEGWGRSQYWETTGLPWHSPSPNLPSPACALVYPGACLLEGTWLSEGRGTARPFETLGSPWIDGERLREALAALELPGATFSSLYFSPSSSKCKGEECEGVFLNVVDRDAYRALDTGIAIIRAVRELWPAEFRWRESWENDSTSFFDRLAGGPILRSMIDALAPLDECLALASEGRETFIARRAPYLIYE